MSDNLITIRDVDHDTLEGKIYEAVDRSDNSGVLILHGSGGGGGYERRYGQLLAHHGYTVFCVEYFGSSMRREVLAEIPISYFDSALNYLTDQPGVKPDKVGVVGFSRGGEAALLVGSYLEQVGVVIGYVPSGYVFPAPTWMSGVDEECAAWTREGNPLPYIPVDHVVERDQKGMDDSLFGEEHMSSMALEMASQKETKRATIPVEQIDGPVLLISGGRDRIWSSPDLADVVINRLDQHHHRWAYKHCSYPEAGHAIRVPYQVDDAKDPEAKHPLGGTYGANAYASADAWKYSLRFLDSGLHPQV